MNERGELFWICVQYNLVAVNRLNCDLLVAGMAASYRNTALVAVNRLSGDLLVAGMAASYRITAL